MPIVRTEYVVRKKDPETLVVKISPLRRVVFLGVAILMTLIIGFGLGATASDGRVNVPVTVVFVALALVSLVLAAVGRSVVFDKQARIMSITTSFVFIPIVSDETTLEKIDSLTLVHFPLAETRRLPKSSEAEREDQLAPSRKNFGKLYVDVRDERKFIEATNDPKNLQRLGTRIAEFLGVEMNTQHQ